MEKLALMLAQRLVELDPQAVPRVLWEAAKLFRQSTSAEEQQKLLDFQANLCSLTGRPFAANDIEHPAAGSFLTHN